MLTIRELDKESADKYLKILSPANKLPGFLYAGEHTDVVNGFFDGDTFAGLSYGVKKNDDGCLFLHYMQFIKGTMRTGRLVKELENYILYLKNKYGISKIIIHIKDEYRGGKVFKAKAQIPPIYSIFKKIPLCMIEEPDSLNQFMFSTKDLEHLRKFTWYRPDRLKTMGAKMVKWSDFPEEEKQKLAEKEKNKEVAADYVSPGIDDKDLQYDSNTSFALLDLNDNTLLGWIITQEWNDIIWIRRFYIYPEKRGRRLGPSFATSVLDVIDTCADSIFFEIVPGNLQMEKFADILNMHITLTRFTKCDLRINIL